MKAADEESDNDDDETMTFHDAVSEVSLIMMTTRL
jgi:hypothetical protein